MGSIRKSVLGVVFATVLLVGLVLAGPVFAAGAWWQVSSSVRPAVLAAGGEGTVFARTVNVGDGASSGVVTLTDTLPAGVAAQSVQFVSWRYGTALDFQALLHVCEVQPGRVQCTYPEFLPVVAPYEMLEMRIAVKVATGAVSGGNRVEMSGGGAPVASSTQPLAVGAGGVPFGAEDVGLTPEEEGGALDTRAGSHPFQLTSTIALNQTADPAQPPALSKDLGLELPAGLVGNATLVPQCSEQDFGAANEGGVNSCPEDTAVGVVVLTFDEPENLKVTTKPAPLFNLVPARGEPARFGFTVANSAVTFDTSVRSGGDYGVTIGASNITELANPMFIQATFWVPQGTPATTSHAAGAASQPNTTWKPAMPRRASYSTRAPHCRC